ncbi:MAG: hypothetical protein WBF33_06650 [Candidatus Nitrosopolaris sp.]
MLGIKHHWKPLGIRGVKIKKMGRGVLGFVRIQASLLVQLAWWMEQLLHVVDNKATDMSHHDILLLDHILSPSIMVPTHRLLLQICSLQIQVHLPRVGG